MAVVTDKLRILNCSNFLQNISEGEYYTFIGFPNASAFYPSWDSTRPDPTDNYLYLNSYRDNILGVKKINSSDVIRVIPKIIWTSGKRYEMYRHDYSVRNLSPVTSSTRLYDSSYYVMNRDYRVYICINNNSLPSNQNRGSISTEEPLHTDLAPRKEDDGYIWKYLYTISPSDVLKFDSTNYISVPNEWTTTTTDLEVKKIRENAVNGKIETIIIEYNSGVTYPYEGTLEDVPIKGDGTSTDGTGNAKASVVFNSSGTPTEVIVTDGGKNYTFATLDLDSVLRPTSINKAIFNVIIPPPGGHGADVYTELGAFRALIYSRIENDSTNPDFMVGNQFSRIGIIKGVLSQGSNSVFTSTTGSGLHAMVLNEDASGESLDSEITQSSTGAIGNLVSFDSTTKVLTYIQPRTTNIDTYVDGDGNYQIDYQFNDSISGIQTPDNYKLESFNTSSISINGNSYTINTGFTGDSTTISGVVFYFGQFFTSGLSLPDINTKSGEIIYVDNRSSVTRSSQQREDIKIILEF
jgi:hypothetical protein